MSGSVQTPAQQGCRGVLRPKAAIASPPHTVISWERDLGTNMAWISKHSSGALVRVHPVAGGPPGTRSFSSHLCQRLTV